LGNSGLDSSDELRHHLALALVPGLGPGRTAALMERFGSAATALKATYQQLITIHNFLKTFDPSMSMPKLHSFKSTVSAI
jgi:excinuclease UvrABC nuclease subunit